MLELTYLAIAIITIMLINKAIWDLKMLRNNWGKPELYQFIGNGGEITPSFKTTVIRLHGINFLNSLQNHR